MFEYGRFLGPGMVPPLSRVQDFVAETLRSFTSNHGKAMAFDGDLGDGENCMLDNTGNGRCRAMVGWTRRRQKCDALARASHFGQGRLTIL